MKIAKKLFDNRKKSKNNDVNIYQGLPVPKNKIIPLEEEEQKTLVEYLEIRKLRFTAIPNSTWTPSMSQKVKNKAMGLRPGLPDMIVLLPNRILFVELKRASGGVLSQQQQEWQAELNKIPNVMAVVCYGAGQAIDIIEEFLKK